MDEETLEDFLNNWQDEQEQNKLGFIQLRDTLTAQQGVVLTFHSRPGLTYSLRAARYGQKKPLFVMIDVIEDSPRWLSICFFNEMVQDPEERGSFVPGGLLGEDALCFDIEICTEDALRYIEDRLHEAFDAAAS